MPAEARAVAEAMEEMGLMAHQVMMVSVPPDILTVPTEALVVVEEMEVTGPVEETEATVGSCRSLWLRLTWICCYC
jgi:hypothetical protein